MKHAAANAVMRFCDFGEDFEKIAQRGTQGYLRDISFICVESFTGSHAEFLFIGICGVIGDMLLGLRLNYTRKRPMRSRDAETTFDRVTQIEA